MGFLSKLFKKDKDKKGQSGEITGSIDRYDWHFDSAAEIYCQKHGKSSDELSDEDYDEIALFAANHIGMFLVWIIDNHFEGEEHKEENAEALEAVRGRTMSGTEFLMNYCDGKFWKDDLCVEILPFVEWYYYDSDNRYLDDYTKATENKGYFWLIFSFYYNILPPAKCESNFRPQSHGGCGFQKAVLEMFCKSMINAS